jgi:phosphoribosyl-AMP cyclohydrolase
MLDIRWDDRGLVPAIVQDYATGDVLMLGYMNEDALRQTMESGHAWFWSRSRKELWHKGATSGNFLDVKELWYDCDVDAILVKAKPAGPTCHTGERSCFYRKLSPSDLEP